MRIRPGTFKAYTLLEVLISFTLFILLLSLVFGFLVPTTRISSRVSARVDMQNAALVVLSRITDDVEKSTDAGLSVDSDTAARSASPMISISTTPSPLPTTVTLCIQPLLNATGGLQQWDTHLTAYCWNALTQNLICKQYDAGNDPLFGLLAEHPQRLLSSQVALVDAAQMGSTPYLLGEETLATHVTLFLVTMADVGPSSLPVPNPSDPNGVGYVIQPINIHLVMQRTAATGRRLPETLDLQRWVSSRNSD